MNEVIIGVAQWYKSQENQNIIDQTEIQKVMIIFSKYKTGEFHKTGNFKIDQNSID